MNHRGFIVKNIDQVDNHTFLIEWGDGVIKKYRLSNLQRCCPCANCVDEKSGERILNDEYIKEDVRAIYIKNVGRYALKIQFTTGCSSGIFGFDLLRRMGG